MHFLFTGSERSGQGKEQHSLDNDSKPSQVPRVRHLSPHSTRPDEPSPGPFPLHPLPRVGRKREKKLDPHLARSCLFSKICLRSRKLLQPTPGGFAALLASNQILPHRQKKSPALSLLLLLHRELSVHKEKKTPFTESIYLLLSPIPTPEARSFLRVHARQQSTRRALGLPRVGATCLGTSLPHQLVTGDTAWSGGLVTSLRPCTQTPHSQGHTRALGRNAAATSQEQKTHRQRATHHTPGCWFSNHVPLLGCSVAKTSLYTSDCCRKLRTTMQSTSEKDLEVFRVGPNQTERLWVIKPERT